MRIDPTSLRSTLFALAAVLVTSPLLAADSPRADLPVYTDEIDVLGHLHRVVPVSPGEPVRIVFGVGELDIEAAEVSELEAELIIGCGEVDEDKCGRYQRKVRVDPVKTDEGLEIRLLGLSKRILRRIDVTGSVIVPRDSPLAVQIGIGDVDIEGGDRDLLVRMGIGDLSVQVPEEQVGDVTVRTRIGDGSITLPKRYVAGKRKMLIGAKTQWVGDGESRVDVKLRIGDARVRLE